MVTQKQETNLDQDSVAAEPADSCCVVERKRGCNFVTGYKFSYVFMDIIIALYGCVEILQEAKSFDCKVECCSLADVVQRRPKCITVERHSGPKAI